MKAMILAAGRGERMRPLTDRVPKPLLMAGGKPLLQHHIERLVAAGVRDLVINTCWLGAQIRAFAGDGSRFGARIAWSHEDPVLETAGGIRRALPQLGGAPFIVVNADIWSDYDYAALAGKCRDAALGHLVLVPNPPHNPGGDFALDPLGRLDLSASERFTFAGISVLAPALFADVPDGPGPLAPVLRRHAETVTGEIHRGLWFDIGTPARLAELDARLADPILQ